MAPTVSVILSTFEQPNALRFSLLGYARQTFRDFEVIVADDGSGAGTREVVEEFRKAAIFEIGHVRQENHGYRRPKIANAAVRQARGRILLLSDGDCIPHRDFVRHHAEACGDRTFCVGGYLKLDADASRRLTPENVAAGEYEARISAADRWRFRIIHAQSLFYIAMGRMDRPKVYGCNISVDRAMYEAVNGYDENFDGFGKEDSDLRNRLRRSGARAVSLWGKAVVFHLDDAIDPMIRERRVPRRKFPEYYNRSAVPVRCVNGLVKEGPPAEWVTPG